ncbi:DUF7512 family protein [Halorussus amylolyticus]|uniref:DUF7512 family protein n=1 Tax=Halorussus amylolyticus TaxID=1126242 RepID=UPI00192F31C0|nr:hypothetical protein [Halorussus amylolyticus]
MVAAEGPLTVDFEAMRLVGLVVVEVAVLYLRYGALERAVGPAVKQSVVGEN